MKIRIAVQEDVPSITGIYNDAVLHTTATFDTEIKTVDERMEWFRKHNEHFPLLVAELEGMIVGYASLSQWSDKCAYNATAENSVYVHRDFRNRGIGKVLLNALLEKGKQGGIHCVLARITADNEASVHMHVQAGFEKAGLLREVGKKFDRLLDVWMLQYLYK